MPERFSDSSSMESPSLFESVWLPGPVHSLCVAVTSVRGYRSAGSRWNFLRSRSSIRSDVVPLFRSLSCDVPAPLDFHLDQTSEVVPETFATTGCKIGKQAFMTPSVGSRAVVMLSRTPWYVTSALSKSLFIATIRTIDMAQILRLRDVVSVDRLLCRATETHITPRLKIAVSAIFLDIFI